MNRLPWRHMFETLGTGLLILIFVLTLFGGIIYLAAEFAKAILKIIPVVYGV